MLSEAEQKYLHTMATCDDVTMQELEDMAEQVAAQDMEERKKVLSDMEGVDKDFVMAVQQGTVESRSRLGQMFGRSPVGKSEEYKACKGWEAKKQFRLKWADAKMDDLVAAKTRKTILKEKWLKRGRHMSFKKIVEAAGDDEAGKQAARAHIRRCLQYRG